jgi:hypothetical protein
VHEPNLVGQSLHEQRSTSEVARAIRRRPPGSAGPEEDAGARRAAQGLAAAGSAHTSWVSVLRTSSVRVHVSRSGRAQEARTMRWGWRLPSRACGAHAHVTAPVVGWHFLRLAQPQQLEAGASQDAGEVHGWDGHRERAS